MKAVKEPIPLYPNTESTTYIKTYMIGDKANYTISTNHASAIAKLKLKGYRLINQIQTEDGLVLFMKKPNTPIVNFICKILSARPEDKASFL